MKNVGLILGIFASIIIIGSVPIALSDRCEDHRKEFSHFNINLAKGLTEYLNKTGKTDFIAAKDNRYELAEIKALNANSEIMEWLRKNKSGIYFSARKLSSWRSWLCDKV